MLSLPDLAPLQRASDVRDLFTELARAVIASTASDACVVSCYDGDVKSVREVAGAVVPGVALDAVARDWRLADFPLTERVLEDGGSLQVGVGDPSADRAEVAMLDDNGFARVLMCRLAAEGRAVGLVEVYRRADVPFDPLTIGRAEILCSFAAGNLARLELAAELESHYTATIEAMVSALEARDPVTQRHASRLRDLAGAVALALDLEGPERQAVRLGAILHDVGKIGIADAILSKPGPLAPDELAIMRTHTEIGERVLSGVPFLTGALPIVRHHHERWDGAGYPDGLAGEEIPLGARIVAACDAWDAMTCDRPYRRARSLQDAATELRNGSGTQWDPLVVETLLALVERTGGEDVEERIVRYAPARGMLPPPWPPDASSPRGARSARRSNGSASPSRSATKRSTSRTSRAGSP
jgi:HD-GYP domain-containing protein (c-di-GMP phosphodiesterase class II)